MAKLPPPLEAEIHASIVQWVYAANVPGLIVHHSPNEGKRGPLARRWLKDSGTVRGWPDLEFLFRGHWLAMEVKRPGEDLSPAQLAVHTRIADAGFVCCTVWTLEEAQKELATWTHNVRQATPHWGAAA